ncbi:MAG TPA: hypothetical protein VNW73_00955, partial [Ktedonobacteraceae bacterium]|nr:hypothetical protein [Ktedonobacteraceae bacterium]
MLDPTLARPRFKPVGITKGPGENAHEYTFVSRDDEQVLKNGEYVYYELFDPQNVGVPLAGTRPPGVIESVNVADILPSGLSELGQDAGNYPSRRVLGRIIKRLPLQLYPDTFLAEPEISPAQVAAMVGYDSHANELFELHVAIMGYYDVPTNSFINPWIPPQSGKKIFLADDEMLGHILSRKRTGEAGSATIGSLLTRAPDAVPVVLSVKDVVSTHL